MAIAGYAGREHDFRCRSKPHVSTIIIMAFGRL